MHISLRRRKRGVDTGAQREGETSDGESEQDSERTWAMLVGERESLAFLRERERERERARE